MRTAHQTAIEDLNSDELAFIQSLVRRYRPMFVRNNWRYGLAISEHIPSELELWKVLVRGFASAKKANPGESSSCGRFTVTKTHYDSYRVTVEAGLEEYYPVMNDIPARWTCADDDSEHSLAVVRGK